MENTLLQSPETVELYAALIAAQGEFTTVPKNKVAKVRSQKTNSEYTYNYADLADVLEMAVPILARHGIGILQPHVRVNGEVRVCTRLVHKSGQWIQSDGLVIDEKAQPQDVGAESSYFRRYDCCSMLGIVADEDVDGERGNPRGERTAPRDVPVKTAAPPPPAPTAVPDPEKEKLLARLKELVPDKDQVRNLLKKMFPDHNPKKGWTTSEVKRLIETIEKERVPQPVAQPAPQPTSMPADLPPDVAAMFGEGKLTTAARVKGPTIGLGKAKRLIKLLEVHKIHTKEELEANLRQIGVSDPADIPQDLYEEMCAWAEGSREETRDVVADEL